MDNSWLDDGVACDVAFLAYSKQVLAPTPESGLGAGGEEGPVKSAGLLVVTDLTWPSVDLRQDWVEEDAIPALRLCRDAHAPQMQDYINRAIAPEAAPSYGVPGDD